MSTPEQPTLQSVVAAEYADIRDQANGLANGGSAQADSSLRELALSSSRSPSRSCSCPARLSSMRAGRSRACSAHSPCTHVRPRASLAVTVNDGDGEGIGHGRNQPAQRQGRAHSPAALTHRRKPHRQAAVRVLRLDDRGREVSADGRGDRCSLQRLRRRSPCLLRHPGRYCQPLRLLAEQALGRGLRLHRVGGLLNLWQPLAIIGAGFIIIGRSSVQSPADRPSHPIPAQPAGPDDRRGDLRRAGRAGRARRQRRRTCRHDQRDLHRRPSGSQRRRGQAPPESRLRRPEVKARRPSGCRAFT